MAEWGVPFISPLKVTSQATIIHVWENHASRHPKAVLEAVRLVGRRKDRHRGHRCSLAPAQPRRCGRGEGAGLQPSQGSPGGRRNSNILAWVASAHCGYLGDGGRDGTWCCGSWEWRPPRLTRRSSHRITTRPRHPPLTSGSSRDATDSTMWLATSGYKQAELEPHCPPNPPQGWCPETEVTWT